MDTPDKPPAPVLRLVPPAKRRAGRVKVLPLLKDRFATWAPARQARWLRDRAHYEQMALDVISAHYKREGRKVGRVRKLTREELADSMGVCSQVLRAHFEPEEIDGLYTRALELRNRRKAAATIAWQDILWTKVEHGDMAALRLWAEYNLQKPAEKIEWSEPMIRAAAVASGLDPEAVMRAYRDEDVKGEPAELAVGEFPPAVPYLPGEVVELEPGSVVETDESPDEDGPLAS